MGNRWLREKRAYRSGTPHLRVSIRDDPKEGLYTTWRPWRTSRGSGQLIPTAQAGHLRDPGEPLWVDLVRGET